MSNLAVKPPFSHHKLTAKNQTIPAIASTILLSAMYRISFKIESDDLRSLDHRNDGLR
jgi:hypothetical protein